jgi:hypothetical protein
VGTGDPEEVPDELPPDDEPLPDEAIAPPEEVDPLPDAVTLPDEDPPFWGAPPELDGPLAALHAAMT